MDIDDDINQLTMFFDYYTKHQNCCDSFKEIYISLVKKLYEYRYSPSMGFEYNNENSDNIIEVYHKLYQLILDVVEYENEL